MAGTPVLWLANGCELAAIRPSGSRPPCQAQKRGAGLFRRASDLLGGGPAGLEGRRGLGLARQRLERRDSGRAAASRAAAGAGSPAWWPTVISGCISLPGRAGRRAYRRSSSASAPSCWPRQRSIQVVVDLGRGLAALVDDGDRLVADAGRQRDRLQGIAAGLAGDRQQRALGPHGLVQVIEDGGAVDQALAVVEHQHRHAHERIEGAQLLGVAEHRQELPLEGMPSTVSETPTRRTKGES